MRTVHIAAVTTPSSGRRDLVGVEEPARIMEGRRADIEPTPKRATSALSIVLRTDRTERSRQKALLWCPRIEECGTGKLTMQTPMASRRER